MQRYYRGTHWRSIFYKFFICLPDHVRPRVQRAEPRKGLQFVEGLVLEARVIGQGPHLPETHY